MYHSRSYVNMPDDLSRHDIPEKLLDRIRLAPYGSFLPNTLLAIEK